MVASYNTLVSVCKLRKSECTAPVSMWGERMPRKIRSLKADLRAAGCMMRPGKGSHTVWGDALIPDTFTLSDADGDDARPYQEREVPRLIDKMRKAQGQP